MKIVLFLVALVAAGTVAGPAKLDGLHHHDHNHHDHHHHDHHHQLIAQPNTFSATGYDYSPPSVPSGLYELPTTRPPPPPITDYLPPPTTRPPPPISSYLPPVTTTTTTPRPPPPPPPPTDTYLPPDEVPEPNEPIVDVIRPGGTTTTMMPMPYDFEWGVSDPESGNMFNHVEDSDGKVATGEYSVLLPDNRIQTVRFRSDPINGYTAEVSYRPAN